MFHTPPILARKDSRLMLCPLRMDPRDDDRFEIIAFHDASAKTLMEMDEKTRESKDRYWAGKDLPFPVLLDSTGETVGKQYRITTFPTMVLFDPEGRFVGRADLEMLKKALDGKVTTPQPRKRDSATDAN